MSLSSFGIRPARSSITTCRTRDRSSLAASSVKVTAAIALGLTPEASIRAIRPAIRAVFPEPAPASTNSDRSWARTAVARDLLQVCEAGQDWIDGPSRKVDDGGGVMAQGWDFKGRQFTAE